MKAVRPMLGLRFSAGGVQPRDCRFVIDRIALDNADVPPTIVTRRDSGGSRTTETVEHDLAGILETRERCVRSSSAGTDTGAFPFLDGRRPPTTRSKYHKLVSAVYRPVQRRNANVVQVETYFRGSLTHHIHRSVRWAKR